MQNPPDPYYRYDGDDDEDEDPQDPEVDTLDGWER